MRAAPGCVSRRQKLGTATVQTGFGSGVGGWESPPKLVAECCWVVPRTGSGVGGWESPPKLVDALFGRGGKSGIRAHSGGHSCVHVSISLGYGT